jgi:hypothetical protein
LCRKRAYYFNSSSARDFDAMDTTTSYCLNACIRSDGMGKNLETSSKQEEAVLVLSIGWEAM